MDCWVLCRWNTYTSGCERPVGGECPLENIRNKKPVRLESVIDLDEQARENNAAMRKVIDFITEDIT